MNTESATAITRTVAARLPTEEGEFFLYHYSNTRDHKEHLALVYGDVREGERIPVRVHSECFTGDVLGSRRCDCGGQLHRAMQMIAAHGRGVIVYLRQEGRGIGLAAKLRAYNLQDAGYDTVEANLLLGHQADEREYWAAAAILADLRVRSIDLLTNNPAKIEHLRALGVRVEGRTPVVAAIHNDNRAYLEAKVQRMRHILDLSEPKPTTNGAPANGAAGRFPAEVEDALERLRARIEARPAGSRPFVTLTYAQSLNGAIAGPGGRPLRISGDATMRLTHALRALHDTILVGIGAVLADDPRLTVRLVEGPQPQPVILDSTLRLPAAARILQHPRPVLVAAAELEVEVDPDRAARLEERGAAILPLPSAAPGRIDLAALLDTLGARGVRSLMVEGGAQVLREFLRTRLVDAVVVTIAPRFVDGLAALGADADARAAAPLPALRDLRYTPLDGDLVVWGAP